MSALDSLSAPCTSTRVSLTLNDVRIAYRFYLQNRYAYLSLDQGHRATLVVALGAIVLMIAAADELTRTGLGLIVWLGVLAASIWAMVLVYQDSKSY